MLRTRACLPLLAALALAPVAAAADDFDRSGFYLGANGVWATNFFESDIENLFPGLVDIRDAAGFNVRAGYRFFSWLALEGMVEYTQGFDLEILGLSVADLTNVTTLANLKFILPIWRIQPYLLLGAGAQHTDVSSGFPLLDQAQWSFAGRPAFGIDFYITKNWLLNGEVAGVLGTSTLEAGNLDVTDLFYLTAGGGFQYRF